MNSPDNITKRGLNTVREGVDAVTSVTKKVPDLVRKITEKDKTGTGTPPKYIVVEDLSDHLKQGYLSVLVWLVHVDDSQIDERELCEIQLLMTQLRCSAAVRKAVREDLENPNQIVVQVQIDRILNDGFKENDEMILALKCSLMKDAIRVYRATSEGPAWENSEIRRLANMLKLEDKKVEFIESVCQKDEKILSGELSDSQIKNMAKIMAAQATAVGIPIASVYLSGSVVGLSAAGIASGLATLGVGGVLGLSAMVTGIGVAIILGGIAYKGVQWALDGAKRDRTSIRELMLQEVLQMHQRAIINLGEDMSHFGKRIAELAQETEINRKSIKELLHEVILLSRSASAMTRLGEQASNYEHDLHETSGRSKKQDHAEPG